MCVALCYMWFILIYLKQKTTDIIIGGESPASTQPHVNGATNKTRADEWSPERDQLKETGSKSQSNAQAVQNEIMTGSDW